MSRYALNLPQQLKQDAEAWAKLQGVSLNQFILWATAEKVGALNQQLDDPLFPLITLRRGKAGNVEPVIRGTRLRVQTVVIAQRDWGLTAKEIAEEYDLSVRQIEAALAYHSAHSQEIDDAIAREIVVADGQNE